MATPIDFRSGPGNPCPVCGAGSKGCSATEDGLHFCRGADSPPDGWVDVLRGREDSQGFRHYRRRDDRDRSFAAPRLARRKTVKPPKPKKFSSEEKGVALPLAFRQKLADCLRIPVEATFALPMGWADGEWRWPEVNGHGEVIGIARRFATGDKCMVDGSHRGVVAFTGWKDRPGPVLVCEGMSDGLAATAAGFGALSRANAKDGSTHLPGLLKDVPADRDIVFVLDPDKDGTVGGSRVAANVAADLGRPVKVAPTPAGFKDLRAYLTGPTWGETPWAERGRLLLDHLDAAARPVDSGAAGVGDEPSAAPPGTMPPAVADAGFERSPYPWGRHPFTDHGNARRLMQLSGEDVLYIAPWDQWYVWDGVRWKSDITLEIDRLAARATHGIWWEATTAQNPNAREAAERWWLLSQNAGRQRAMVSLTKGMAAADYEDFDQRPELFNAANGTIDLATGELREPDRGDRLTVRSPVNFQSSATCPVWKQTLAQIFARDPDNPAAGGDAELIEFIHRLFGCCLTGIAPPILPIFWGTGANGKSLVVRVVSHVLGRDYAVSVANEVLMEGTDQHPTGLADLYAKRVAFCVETNDGQSLNASLIKQLTGGDRVRARRMRQDFWEFAPTHTLILCTNHKPRVPGDDAAVWRRLALVPFRCVFWNPDKDESGPEHRRQDRDLEKKLLAEAEGILAWLVRGAAKFLRDGLPTPKVVTDQTKEYRANEDIIGQFLAERTQTISGTRVTKGALYDAYRKWADGEGFHPVSSKKFTAAMEAKGHQGQKSGSVRYWVNLDLDNADEISREFDDV